MNSHRPSARRLILFGRYPVPGKTKTRLIPLLGPAGAAELQRHLTEKSLVTLIQSHLAPVAFCHTGGTRRQLHSWLGHHPVRLTTQVQGDLGTRMEHALFSALNQGCNKVVLVGTDVPGMTAGHLSAAFEALSKKDIVLGSSLDGGYWLVGLRCQADIFRNIAWSTPDVLAQTLAVARSQRLSTALLEPLNDIDTEADLKAWQPEANWQHPYMSVIIPALNEEATITKAIEGARSPDSEIIVVDGGSNDKTMARAQEAGARVIVAPRGRALQQNSGARRARGCVLLFLHADTRLPDNYGAQVFETLMASQVSAGAFGFKTDYDNRGMRLIEKAARIRSAVFNLPYGDQALFMTKTQFDKVGGFPLVPIAEDLHLVRRLARQGRIRLAPGAAVTSGRRWRSIGIWRATAINYLIAGGCLAGVPPKYLAPLYKLWVKE